MVKQTLALSLILSLLASSALAQQTVVGGPGAPPAASGGAGNPGGSSNQIQYNNGGVFGGLSTLTNISGLITNSASTTGAAYQQTGTYTASTSSAFLYIDPASTATSTFSANGTLLGINAVTGFTGNAIDFQLNGATKFSVNSTGAAVLQGNISVAGTYQKGGSNIIGAKPTSVSSGGGFGTSPGTSVGTSSMAFTIVTGTSPTSGTFTLTFPSIAVNGWICRGTDLTVLTNYVETVAVTSTTVTTMQNYNRTTGAATALGAADTVAFMCSAY